MSPASGHTRRAVLIHWKPAEAEARLPVLRNAGWDAECVTPDGSAGLAGIRADPPQAVVIDLTRLPSHGRAVASALRQYKQTRRVPIVFAGGTPEKVAGLRQLMPDAIYTDWDEIDAALSEALRASPDEPIVPATMEGYSGTPLWKKLGLKERCTVALLGAPQGFTAKLAIPFDVAIRKRAAAADRVLLFVRSSKDLKRSFASAARSVKGTSGLWLIWPKKASGIECDLNETLLREYGMQRGWVDFKVCAVDATWSGLQFARKRD